MWSKFLRIQQNLFGEDREQMITTYRKMATLAVAIGQPGTSSKYLKIAHKLLEKYQNSGDNKVEKTEE